MYVRRWHGIFSTAMGICRADAAIAAWGRALELAGGTTSARSRAALASACDPIAAYRARGVPGAAGLVLRMRRARAW
jgi:hypothetical protein